MLTITRHIGESIIINAKGEIIEIFLSDIRGSIAKIGINADRDILILRKELICDKDYETLKNDKSSEVES